MGRRPAHPQFKRTRDTHDPQTSLPTALQEELSLPENSNGSSSTKAANRKAERKRKRREKRQAEHQATAEWRARRQNKHVVVQKPAVTAEEPALPEPKEKPTRAAPKRKRSTHVKTSAQVKDPAVEKRSKPTPEQAQTWDDPDAREARRLEKLLGIRRKKKRKTAKGKSFGYSDMFGDDEEMVDLLDFCDNTISRTRDGPKVSDADSAAQDHDSEHEDEEESEEELEMRKTTQQLAQKDEGRTGPSFGSASDGEVSSEESSSGASNGNIGSLRKDTTIQRAVEETVVDERISTKPSRKYVPPGSRGQANANTAVTRRMRGLLNRVADANASTIASSVIQIFEDRDKSLSLPEVAAIYAQCTLDAVRDGSGIGYINPYLHSHAAIATHAASRVDDVVLASLLVSAVKRFDRELPTLEADSEILNEAGNQSDAFGYTALIVSLYERGAVSCTMIYDLVKTIGESLSSERLGLLLALLRQVGPILRQDDPTSLKDMIQFIHAQADKLNNCLDTTAEEAVNLKLQIMLDLIDDIKNNKVKRSALQETNARFVWVDVPESPISASLTDLLNDSFTSTRWWVGDGGAGDVEVEDGNRRDKEVRSSTQVKLGQANEPNINSLASSLRLNAGRRKELFKVIIGSPNVSEAFERLEGMAAFDTKKHHDRDTAVVILHCCGSEKMFNPFYAYLAERMCKRARRSRFTFEFACWDIFKSIPGTAKTKPMSTRRARNFEHLLAHLWHCEALSLSVLRYVQDFEDCGEQEASFYAEAIELLFAKLAKGDESTGAVPFHKLLSEKWNGVDTFRVSLALFLRRNVRSRLGGSQSRLLNEAIHVLEDGETS